MDIIRIFADYYSNSIAFIMMDIPPKYKASATEKKWYRYWMDHNLFHSEPDHREPYCIAIPPPNVTGVLHMGHMLNNTIQDVLVRRARMQGKNACWVPGTDHASIATEAKVVGKLAQEGIRKQDIGREEFVRHAWEWTDKHGGIILDQLKRLGASCDWERTCFTMDEARYESVIDVFIDLFNKGMIYRGIRMVNWDPQARTAVSDEEVLYREEQSELYHVRYRVVGSEEFVTIATTRPETILGDTAVCFHPEDERYQHLKGKKVIVPMVEREVPLIEDEYVDPEFGTGCLKITPAHDINDYEIGIRHNLEVVDILNEDGTLSEAACLFVGMDRFEARKATVGLLEKQGNLVKVESYLNKVGRSERTDAVIEPKVSMQWFLKMKELARPALEAVENDVVRLQPPKFKNTYRHWMENVKDWCISRQLWWGQRLPVYYIIGSKEYVVARTDEEALEKAREKTGDPALTAGSLQQDADVVDTWFSSWLWPVSVFDGIRKPQNPDIQYYYPTNDLVTAPEILFFWVARMIIAGYEYRNEKPFRNVYLTGIVRDSQRRKMSKSLGNSPDPVALMERFGADGVRVGMLLCSPAGNDLLFDESLTGQGRNFGNKIWNAFRLIHQWEVSKEAVQPDASKEAVHWFEQKLNKTVRLMNDQFDKFRISDALMLVYKLFWDDFSSWYLEAVKPEYGKPVDAKSFAASRKFLDQLMRLLHPFMPFISEEIWQRMEDRMDGESLMIELQPAAAEYDQEVIDAFEHAREIITTTRALRKEKNLSFKEKLSLYWISPQKHFGIPMPSLIRKLGGYDRVEQAREKPEGALTFRIRTEEYYIPVAEQLDMEAEIQKLHEELEYTRGFLVSVEKKLANERFVQNAPEKVVAMERKKKSDAETRIRILEQRLQDLQ